MRCSVCFTETTMSDLRHGLCPACLDAAEQVMFRQRFLLYLVATGRCSDYPGECDRRTTFSLLPACSAEQWEAEQAAQERLAASAA